MNTKNSSEGGGNQMDGAMPLCAHGGLVIHVHLLPSSTGAASSRHERTSERTMKTNLIPSCIPKSTALNCSLCNAHVTQSRPYEHGNTRVDIKGLPSTERDRCVAFTRL